jgi:hypothetical protein
MVHEPAPVRCTVPGDGLVTVQLPVGVKLAAKPEEAVALTLKSASPNVLFARDPNVIVWFALLTVSVKLASTTTLHWSMARIVMLCVPAGAAFSIVTTPESLTYIIPV